MMETKVKVVRFNKTGDASVLELVNEPLQQPKANEVRIKVEAIGLNRAEIMFRNGAYLEQPNFPSKLGYEASGIVDAVGANVTTIQVGDKVSTIPAFSMGTYGVYGESATVPEHAVTKYPDNLSSIQAASIWMQYITAYGALIDIGRLNSKHTVLITAASSSVGIAAIQIAKYVGAKVIATTRGERKKEELLNAGADYVIVTESEKLVDSIVDITDRNGVDLVFDPIGGPILEQLADAATVGARIIEYGALDARETPFPLFYALAKGLIIQGYTLFEITKNIERLNAATNFIIEGLRTGHLMPLVDRQFTLDDIRDAQLYMEANDQIGKIVVTV